MVAMSTKIHPSQIKAGMRVRPAAETAIYGADGAANESNRLATPNVIEATSDAELVGNGLSALRIRLDGRDVAVRITGWDVEVL